MKADVFAGLTVQQLMNQKYDVPFTKVGYVSPLEGIYIYILFINIYIYIYIYMYTIYPLNMTCGHSHKMPSCI